MTSCTCLEWKDLEFTKGKKKILKRIGGRAESKELLAIMGPSGLEMIHHIVFLSFNFLICNECIFFLN